MILTERNNRFYLVDTMILDSIPVKRNLYFRVEFMEGHLAIGKEFYKSNPGVYRAVGATVTINPSAPCELMEDEPVPQPKTRKNTKVRWYQGGWQKWSNTKGWISA